MKLAVIFALFGSAIARNSFNTNTNHNHHHFDNGKQQQLSVKSKLNSPLLNGNGKGIPGSCTVVAAGAASSSASINAAALRAVAKLIATCGMGITASKTGLLDKTALSVLSKLVFGLFQPCLLFTSVASTVAKVGGSGGALRLVPMAALVQVIIGFMVAKIISLIVYGKNQDSEEAKQLLASTSFGNSGPLPLVFVDALLRSHQDPTLLPQSVAYISLYLLGWSPLFWMCVPAILAPSSTGSTTTGEKLKVLASRVFSPPIVGALCGMLVGLVPFLRKLFLPDTGIFNPLFSAAQTLGGGYLPSVLLVLAGSMAPAPAAPVATTAGPAPATTAKATGENAAFIKQIVCIYAARFWLLPTLAFALIAALKKYVPSLAPLLADPVLIFVLLLESCMPSAQNSTVVLQLAGNPAAAARMAKVLMFIYVLGIPAISYWLVRVLSTTGLA